MGGLHKSIPPTRWGACQTAVLPCRDLLDVMREAALFLPEPTGFATTACPYADEVASRGVHQGEPFVVSARLALNLRTEMKSSVLM